ncbi:MAG: FAD-binding oxidoreductase [Acidobacteria bacterium]|nr:FAD-binding oxidoreductase [Acidobacteriota bacterium]MCW5948666.1 FAD-binding oxidoreductase [Pyrinomonadaceae bacterium]
MPDRKIVIIGGGVVGASVAYHLAERGARDIVLLERADALGAGSTGKATGGIRAQFETEINILLSLYSLEFLKNWDFDCEYDARGYLFLARDQDQLLYLDATRFRQQDLGYDDVYPIDTEAISAVVPGLNTDDIVGGSFGLRDGFINPLALLEGFITGAVSAGTRVVTSTNVESISVDHGRVRNVRTASGTLECDAVVICSGPWARPIAATAGVDLPVTPQRRQIVWAQTERQLPAGLPMVIDLEDGFHFRPARDFSFGSNRAGSGYEVLFAYSDRDEGPSESTEFDEAFVEKVYQRARHRAPFLADSSPVLEKCRAGLYENTPDHHAIIGGCEVEGLYLACGFSGHGVMHSPATGRALSEIILDGEAKFLDVSSLHIDRFANGRLLRETGFI